MKRVQKIDQNMIDDLCDYYDTHPNVTLREIARLFRLDIETVKHILTTN